MNHINEDKLLEYALETSADSAERSEIAAHLAICPECHKRLEDFQNEIKIIGGIRPFRPALSIPTRQVRSNFIYRVLRTAALIILGIAAGLGGSRLANRHPAMVSPAYLTLSPPPDSVNSYVVADATLISAELQ
jgi:anti-sigma factor RsiW